MTLGQKQRLFAKLIPRLLDFIYQSGYEVSFGEAKRMPEQSEINAMGVSGRIQLAELIATSYPFLAIAIRNKSGGGIRNSLHEFGLAIDLNLFKDGVYLASTMHHQKFGEYWEKLDPLCAWGGRFGDGNHYSIMHDGKK